MIVATRCNWILTRLNTRISLCTRTTRDTSSSSTWPTGWPQSIAKAASSWHPGFWVFRMTGISFMSYDGRVPHEAPHGAGLAWRDRHGRSGVGANPVGSAERLAVRTVAPTATAYRSTDRGHSGDIYRFWVHRTRQPRDQRAPRNGGAMRRQTQN